MRFGSWLGAGSRASLAGVVAAGVAAAGAAAYGVTQVWLRPPEDTLRVMTWNLRTKDFGPEQWARVIGNQQPDVVTVQEICAEELEPLRKALRQEYDLRYHVALGDVYDQTPSICGTKGRRRYGQALLSRFPLTEVETSTYVPQLGPDELPPTEWRTTNRDGRKVWETRGFLQATVGTPGGPVRVVTTHLGLGDSEKTEELRQLTSALTEDGDRRGQGIPLLVTGDLNTAAPVDVRSAGGEGERRLTEFLLRNDVREVALDEDAFYSWGNLRSFTSWNNARARTAEEREPTCSENDCGRGGVGKLDYLFFRGLEPRAGQPFETYWVACSDHRPLVQDFVLPEAEEREVGGSVTREVGLSRSADARSFPEYEGRWGHHGGAVEIDRSGVGVYRSRTYLTCGVDEPVAGVPCEDWTREKPGMQPTEIRFHLRRFNGQVFTLIDSNNTPRYYLHSLYPTRITDGWRLDLFGLEKNPLGTEEFQNLPFCHVDRTPPEDGYHWCGA